MNAEIESYADFIDMLLEKASRQVSSLSAEALNWEPLDSDSNSIGAIAVHMCGVVRWWVQQGLTGQEVGRKRDTEFTAQVDEKGDVDFWGVRRSLGEVIAETRSISRDVLSGLDPASLGKESAVYTMGPRLNRWALVHAIDELSQHVGHMELTAQLYDARA